MKEARLYQKLDENKVQCQTCAHGCKLEPDQKGICGVRQNIDGKLFSLVYGKAIATHVDPIEKKPLFHYLPGSRSYSVATVGCNMRCENCQNADISQMPRDQKRIMGQDLLPGEIVQTAMQHGCRSISYTYTEPAVFWDYAYDTAVLAKEQKLRNVFVTNGFWSEKSLNTMAPLMDAANVDLKSFRDATYRLSCGARLEPVLETIRAMHEHHIWIEITTLLIPDLNDSNEELEEIADFIAETGPEIPWHISRFYPTYKMPNRMPTPPESIYRALKIGRKAGLKHVYAGNMPGDAGEQTLCPDCRAALIERIGYQIQKNKIHEGQCPGCGTWIEGVWR